MRGANMQGWNCRPAFPLSDPENHRRDAYYQRDVDIAPDHGHSFRAISTTRGLPNLSCFRRPHRDCSVVIAPFRTQYLAGVARPNDTEIAKPDPCQIGRAHV